MSPEMSPETSKPLAPIDLEILYNALVAAAAEMDVTVWRTSRSTIVRELLDYSTAIFDADGWNVAQSARIPGHLNSMSSFLREIVERYIPADDWQPGDVVISNEMVSMVLAQITYEPRIRPVLEDLFQSDGSEIYIKDIACYVPLGQPTTFEHLILAAKVRNEVAMGVQVYVDDAAQRYGLVLNPPLAQRTAPFVPKKGDRLIVLAEDDG